MADNLEIETISELRLLLAAQLKTISMLEEKILKLETQKPSQGEKGEVP